jgi:hypothetical protein
MSSLCDIFPDDPSCAAAEPEPVAEPETTTDPVDTSEGGEEVTDEAGEGEGEGEGEGAEEEAAPAAKTDFSQAAEDAVGAWWFVKSMSSYAMLNPMEAHIMLGLEMLYLMQSGLMEGLFYRSEDKYYDGFKISGKTEYYKLMDQMRNWGYLIVGGTLGVTSLLAAFGIANGINSLLWMFLGLGGMLIQLAVGIVGFLAYEQGYTEVKDKTANKAVGKTIMDSVKYDGMRDAIIDASIMFTFWSAMESLGFEMWNLATAQERKDAIVEWEEAAAELAKSVAEMRETAGLDKVSKAADAEEEEDEEAAEEGEGEDAEEGEGDEEAAEEE